VQQAEVRAGDVTVRVIAPRPIDVDSTARVAADALQTLADRFGPYPWSEVDVIGVSLGPDAGGMEWPGAVWIDGLAEGPGSSALTIDHELAHQWWHALVGNDSIRAPVIDEPLAQYSMCVVAAADGSGCAPLDGGPGGGSGGRTECADRPTTAFASADQYGSLIYDQAPQLYFALASSVGADETIAALRGVVARHAFGIITPAELRDELVAAFPQQADTVRALWDRYIGATGCGLTPSER
jgi:aminopeptidase N